MEYYLTVTRNEGVICPIVWMTLENIMLGKEARCRDHILYVSIYTKAPELVNP